MLTEHAVTETLANSLSSGTRFDDPYPLTLFNPFPEDVYSAILENLPEDRFFKPLMHPDAVKPDGTSTRIIFEFTPESLAAISPEQRDFWSTLNAIMKSAAVRDVFLAHHEPEITKRFGKPLRDVSCYPTARLGRDLEGYLITPHPDSKSRVYTTQAYLPDDDSQTDIGTSVYRKTAEGFEFVRRLPFRRNTAFTFARTDNTFHGVEPIHIKKPRDSLHLSAFQKPTDF